MTNVQIEAGTLTANLEDRIVSGLLLPFGEVGNTNLGKFSVPENRVAIPQDVTVLAANTDHDRENPVARFMTAVATKAGIVATFSVGKNPEGDALLAEVGSDNPDARKKLSAEIKNVVIRDGQLVSGSLFGAAFVKQGAFPSATVLAADVGEPDSYTSHSEDTFTDENGVTWTRVYDTTTETTVEDDGDTKTQTTTTTTVVEETAEPGTDPATSTEGDPAVGTVPNTLTAAKGAATTTEDRGPDLRTIYAAVAAVKAGDNGEARTLLAQLADIKISGNGSLPAGGSVLRENWVGQVWQGKTYERQFINLAKLGTEISAAGKSGFKVHRGTAQAPKDSLGGDWAGNKVEVPTGTGYTEKIGSTLDRFAFAADVAREFYDLPGGLEVVEAFFRLIIEDYAEWSDDKALAYILSAAGEPIAPKVYPEKVGTALGQLLQGILAVKRAKDTPTFAIVNDTAYEELLYTPKDQIPEFVSFQFSTEGNGAADGGKVTVVSAPDDKFTGFAADEPATVVGAKNSIEFDELGSTPLQIDALEVARGGVDRGVHGYLQKFLVRPEGVVAIGTAAA